MTPTAHVRSAPPRLVLQANLQKWPKLVAAIELHLPPRFSADPYSIQHHECRHGLLSSDERLRCVPDQVHEPLIIVTIASLLRRDPQLTGNCSQRDPTRPVLKPNRRDHCRASAYEDQPRLQVGSPPVRPRPAPPQFHFLTAKNISTNLWSRSTTSSAPKHCLDFSLIP